MMRRRKGGFRRRRSGLRWFTPNLWNASAPQVYTADTSGAGPVSEFTTRTALTPLLRGTAPFPGVTNAAGLLAGTMLAERQYFSLLRIVGRMHWWVDVSFDDIGSTMAWSRGGCLSVWWAIVRRGTDEDGRPDTESTGIFPELATRDNQDDKKLILAQDVWRTKIPAGTTAWSDTSIHALDAEQPLDSMIDIRLKRSFRNEQDVYLAVQLGIANFGDNIPGGTTFQLAGLSNLRVLGKFGR